MRDMRAERGVVGGYAGGVRRALGYGASSRSPEIASPDSFKLLYYLLCAFFPFSPLVVHYNMYYMYYYIPISLPVVGIFINNIIMIIIIFNLCLHVDTESYLIVARVIERVYLRAY